MLFLLLISIYYKDCTCSKIGYLFNINCHKHLCQFYSLIKSADYTDKLVYLPNIISCTTGTSN